MEILLYLTCVVICGGVLFVDGVHFSAESFSEISLLAKKGKDHLESLKEKANFPQHGPCWRKAIADLQTGCKFLSETVQSDLALKFTDCFLQMSGHEPVNCDFPKSVCLKKLSDRAFNAYTEFYTHTQSICYFLQSQLWHEEAEKTINKLSSTSLLVSHKLEEAGKVQEKLLNHQKETLSLQHDLINTSRSVASVLQISQEKINLIMKDFQNSTLEQKQLLLDMFGSLLSFRSWAINEMSWFNSTFFFITSTIIGFLFTSVSRTRGARMYIFLIFTLNYLLERFLSSRATTNPSYLGYLTLSTDIYSSIWMCRKFFICLSIIILLYIAISYYDYNVLNYNLLLEIRNQNLKILNHFALEANNKFIKSSNSDYTNMNKFFDKSKQNIHLSNSHMMTSYQKQSQFNDILNGTSSLYDTHNRSYSITNMMPQDDVDLGESQQKSDVSITSEKNNTKEITSAYNLRSGKVKKDYK